MKLGMRRLITITHERKPPMVYVPDPPPKRETDDATKREVAKAKRATCEW